MPIIWRSKDNQTKKFCQSIEYSRKYLKMIQKMWWRNYSQTLFDNLRAGHIFGLITYSFVQFVFIVWQVEGYRNILKLSCRLFSCIRLFRKTKKAWNKPPCLIFCMVFKVMSRFSTWAKDQDKNLNILRTKKDFKMKQGAFFKGFHWSKIFLEDEGLTLSNW